MIFTQERSQKTSSVSVRCDTAGSDSDIVDIIPDSGLCYQR